jgi:agmatine deiminase
MPAEWEPHAATWLVWPQNRSDWPGRYDPIPYVYAEIIRNLVRRERVHLLVDDAAAEKRARGVLAKSDVDLRNVRFHRWPTDRGWTRDTGPIFVRKGRKLVVVAWRFNAWAKYDDWQKDALLARRAARHLRLPSIEPVIHLHGRAHHVVLEGGSIDVNGRGSLLTTEECLLSPVQRRNPSLSRRQLEVALCRYLGASNVLWLDRGIAGDDTHGHIDDIARFVAADTVVACVEPSRADVNHEPLAANFARLRSMRDQDGRRLDVVPLPMPRPIVFRGRRLPASYANFYIANGVVLVPVFNDRNDRAALNILAELFPARDVIPIYAGDLVWGLGTLHCLSQQQPAV